MNLYEQRAWINLILAHLIDHPVGRGLFILLSLFWAVVWVLESRHDTRAS